MHPNIENALEEFVKKRDDIFGNGSKFVNFEYNAFNIRGAVGGLQSNIALGRIRYEVNGEAVLSPPLIVKSPPTACSVSEAVLVQFVNEVFFYGHVLPYFAQLESSAWALFPKFYGSSTQKHFQFTEAVVILEDLHYANYKSAPHKSFLDYSHLSLMVRSLGKFHALSYLARETDPMWYSTHAALLNPIHPAINGQSPGILTKVGVRGLTRLAQQSEYASIVPVIQQRLQSADQHTLSLLKHEQYNPWAVICHGDYLSGNVMFKYEGDHPVDLKMIDFTMSTHASPVSDLALLLYINADQKTRDLHWDRLIDDYIEGLSSLHREIKCLPTKNDIAYEFRENAFYAYLIASVWLPSVIAEDLGLGSYQQFLPEEYADCDCRFEIPAELLIDMHMKIGGEYGTEVLADILKDMFKRGFIWNSSILTTSNNS